MRKFFILFLLVTIFAGKHCFAQIKAKHIWPIPGEFSIKKFHLNFRKSEGDIFYQFLYNDCVDGNCKNGEGVWATANSRNIEFTTNGSLDLTVNLYKGIFSDDGKKFTGKMLTYNYSLQGSGAKNRDFYADKFTPVKTEDLSADLANPILASKYIVAEGEAIRTEVKVGEESKYIYELHGIGASRASMLELGATSMQGKYENGQLQMLKADIKETFPAKSFTGRMSFKNKPLIGRLEFKDGTYYEGFFYDNSYNGPGRLVNSDGKIYQGFWEKGILKDSQQVNLPAFLWNYSANSIAESKPYTITIGDKTYSGQYAGDWKDGKPHGKGFFNSTTDVFFYGGFENGVADGLGYFYRLYNTDTWACCIRRAENVVSGLFTKGWMSYGSYNTVHYMWHNKPSDAKYAMGFTPQYQYLATGSFKNHNLQGCGQKVSREWENPDRALIVTTGHFEDGALHGWYIEEHPLANPKKEKIIGYEIPGHGYYNLFMKNGYIDHVFSKPHGGDVVKHYGDIEKSVAAFLKEVAAEKPDCNEGLISQSFKQKFKEDAKKTGLKARAAATEYLNRPPAPTFVSTYENAVKQVKYTTGTTLLNNGVTSVITGYDFNNNKYEVSKAVYRSEYGMGGRFKGLKDGVERYWLTEAEIESRFKVQQVVYHICAVCNGKGSTTGTVNGGNKGGWEKWTDNVFYNRPSTAYSYEVTTGCGNCKMVGWRQ